MVEKIFPKMLRLLRNTPNAKYINSSKPTNLITELSKNGQRRFIASQPEIKAKEPSKLWHPAYSGLQKVSANFPIDQTIEDKPQRKGRFFCLKSKLSLAT